MKQDKFNIRTLRALLESDEVKAILLKEAEEIARKATAISGYDYKAVQSENDKRASAAVIPDGIEAIMSENKNNHLIRAASE